MERNEKLGSIKFVDISSNDYSPEENQGLDYKTVNFFFFLYILTCFNFNLYHPLFFYLVEIIIIR